MLYPYVQILTFTRSVGAKYCTSVQGRSQDFVIGGLNESLGGGASLKNLKILNIGLRNLYVMFK